MGLFYLWTPLTCLIPVPGVVYWTVSNLTTGFQSAYSAKWIKAGVVVVRGREGDACVKMLV